MSFLKEYEVFLNYQLERVSVADFMNLSKEKVGDLGFLIKTCYDLMREITFCSSSDPSVLYFLKLSFCVFYQKVLRLHPEYKVYIAYKKCLKLMKTMYELYFNQLESLRVGELLEFFKKNVYKNISGSFPSDENLNEEIKKINNLPTIPENFVIQKNNKEEQEDEGEEGEGEEEQEEVPMFSPFLNSPGMSPQIYAQFQEEEKRKRDLKDLRMAYAKLSKRKKKILSNKDLKLRNVRVNKRLIREFLVISQPHIERKVEFAGYLLGKAVPYTTSTDVEDWYFEVTVLLIPDQEGKKDSVETFSEVEIAQFTHRNNLMVIGWIHTHPTQQGRDIFTHYAQFQSNFDEAIAIVCSPRKKRNFGIFRIKTEKLDDAKKMVETRRFGKSSLSNFSLFGGSLYESCVFKEGNGRHCIIVDDEDNAKKVVVVDIRKEKDVKIMRN